MKLPEDIRDFLPRYLTAESTRVLLEELGDYVEKGTTDKVYSYPHDDNNVIYQGDGVCDLPVFQLKKDKDNNEIATCKRVPCIIISNTCDIALENPRKRPVSICYAPLVPLDEFYNALKVEFGQNRADDAIKDVKKQKLTDTFYLPMGAKLKKEYIVFLDKIFNLDNILIDRENLSESRLFTFSNFGFYLFLIKLSINFTRVQEQVDRSFV